MTSAAFERDRGMAATLVRCPGCAHEFAAVDAALQRGVRRCPACDRRITPVGWPRMIRRAGLIAFGVLIQLTTGVIAYLIPPGPSVLTWALYLGMGVVGFLHIFIGLEMKQLPEKRAAWQAAPERRDHAGFEADDVINARCPDCREDLALALVKSARRCPRCRRAFSMRELGYRGDDTAGELARLAPAEMHISDRGGVIVIALVVIAVIGLSALIWAARAGGGAGSNAPMSAPMHSPQNGERP